MVVVRLLFRIPVHLYAIGLGVLFGHRLLVLGHRGRASGRLRRVALEVVERDPVTDGYVICSGFGPRAQWYQNLLHDPRVAFQVGWRVRPAVASFLSKEEGGEIMARYASRHPAVAARLVRFMGFEVDGTPQGFRAVGESLPFVRVTPCDRI